MFSLSLFPTTNNNIKNCPHPVTTFRKSHLGFSIPSQSRQSNPLLTTALIFRILTFSFFMCFGITFTCLSTSSEKSDPSNFWAHIKNSTIIPCVYLCCKEHVHRGEGGESQIMKGKYYHTAGLIFEIIFHSKEKSFVGPDI